MSAELLTCHDGATTNHSPHRGCTCTNQVHQTPGPKSFMSAFAVAERRLADGWTNLACPDCGHFGWLPPTTTPTTQKENPA